MTFPCPHCGRSIDGHILTDTEWEDHEMQVEGLQAKLDYAQGQLANIHLMIDDLHLLANKIDDEAAGD
jgi:hypothetical protein